MGKAALMSGVQLPPSVRRILPSLRPHVELEEWSLVPRGERWMQMRADYGLPRESTRWWEDELGFEPDIGYLNFLPGLVHEEQHSPESSPPSPSASDRSRS